MALFPSPGDASEGVYEDLAKEAVSCESFKTEASPDIAASSVCEFVLPGPAEFGAA